MKKSDSEHTDSGQEIADLVATLDALEAKATPGPWEMDHEDRAISGPIINHDWDWVVFRQMGDDYDETPDELNRAKATHRFIAALRNSYHQLRAAALKEPAGSQLERDREELMEALREVKSQCHNLPRSATTDRIVQIIDAALLSRLSQPEHNK